MIGKQDTPQLITAQEAVKLSRRAGTIDSLELARNIAIEWKRTSDGNNDPIFNYLCMLGAIYDAGRIQGIREQRQTRR